MNKKIITIAIMVLFAGVAIGLIINQEIETFTGKILTPEQFSNTDFYKYDYSFTSEEIICNENYCEEIVSFNFFINNDEGNKAEYRETKDLRCYKKFYDLCELEGKSLNKCEQQCKEEKEKEIKALKEYNILDLESEKLTYWEQHNSNNTKIDINEINSYEPTNIDLGEGD